MKCRKIQENFGYGLHGIQRIFGKERSYIPAIITLKGDKEVQYRQ